MHGIQEKHGPDWVITGLQLVASTSTGAPRLLSFTKTNSPASHSSYQPYPPSLPSLPLASMATLNPTRNNPCCRFRYIAASVDGSRSKKRIMLESSQSQMQMHHFMRPPAPATARCKRLRAYPGSLCSCLVFGIHGSHSHSQSHSYMYSSLH